jgi:hypothetical protein
MSRKELKNMLSFIQNKGACYESEVWAAFIKDESDEEKARVVSGINTLAMKGLIEQRLNEEAEPIIVDSDVLYGS